MKNKLMKSAILGLIVAISAPAFAQHHHPRPTPVPRRDERQPRRDTRRGQWGRGRVVTYGGRYRYRPARPFRMRPNPYAHRPYTGRWDDVIRFELPYGRSVQLLGATYLAQGQDYDVLDVNDYTNCVRAVRLRVEGLAANIDRVSLHFVDGGDEELDVNGVYPASSGDLAWRDLVTAWGARCIDSIVVIGETLTLRDRWGRPIPNRAQALVEIWGLK